MAGAVESELVDSNPVALPSRTKVRTKRAKNIEPLTVAQVADLARAMPARLSMAVLLGCWCAPRYGELSELRRQDVDLKEGVLKVSRGMVKVKGGYFVGDTKTDAGVRRVHVPPPLLPELKTHLDTYVDAGPEALLLPAPNGGHRIRPPSRGSSRRLLWLRVAPTRHHTRCATPAPHWPPPSEPPPPTSWRALATPLRAWPCTTSTTWTGRTRG